MILYLDTSGLVKIFLNEAGSDATRTSIGQADMLATSQVTYAEAMAAFARRHREGGLNDDQLDVMTSELGRLWADFNVIGVDEIAAGGFALRHGLRGFDAIHLAAAMTLHRSIPGGTLSFLSFDARQRAAAKAEGLTLSSIA